MERTFRLHFLLLRQGYRQFLSPPLALFVKDPGSEGFHWYLFTSSSTGEEPCTFAFLPLIPATGKVLTTSLFAPRCHMARLAPSSPRENIPRPSFSCVNERDELLVRDSFQSAVQQSPIPSKDFVQGQCSSRLGAGRACGRPREPIFFPCASGNGYITRFPFPRPLEETL